MKTVLTKIQRLKVTNWGVLAAGDFSKIEEVKVKEPALVNFVKYEVNKRYSLKIYDIPVEFLNNEELPITWNNDEEARYTGPSTNTAEVLASL